MNNIITQSRPLVTVRFDDDFDCYTTEYGPVRGPVKVKSHGRGPDRPCVHAIEQPWSQELFSAAWVAQMSWLPALYMVNGGHVIAAHRNGLLTLAFDAIGRTEFCRLESTPIRLEERNKFYYKLFHMRFEDDPEGEPLAKVLLGVWPD